MTKAIITVGIPASGKSTWAREYVKNDDNAVIVCRDDIRNAHGWDSGEAENRVTQIHRSQAIAAFNAGHDVIFPDTNLTKQFRNKLVKLCHEFMVDVEIVTFDISLGEAMARNEARTEHRVPDAVVMRFFDMYRNHGITEFTLPAPKAKPYEHGDLAYLPSAIVVDIDGTVARHVARSPYDYSKVGTDEPIDDVIDIVRALSKQFHVIFVSGRKSVCYEDTVDWIKRYIFPDREIELFMRKSNDERPDYIIKAELYDEHVIPFYNIVMVFDDRDQVVRHVRARGLTVAQVAPGRF